MYHTRNLETKILSTSYPSHLERILNAGVRGPIDGGTVRRTNLRGRGFSAGIERTPMVSKK